MKKLDFIYIEMFEKKLDEMSKWKKGIKKNKRKQMIS